MKREILDDQTWVSYLNYLIDKELEKPEEEQNWDRINECNEMLDKVDVSKVMPDPQIKEQMIGELLKKAGKQKDDEYNYMRSTWKRKWISRIAVACALLIFVAIPVASSAIYNVSPLEIIKNLGLQILNMSYDSPEDKSGITVTRLNKAQKYNSIDDFLNEANIHILCPSWLPDGVAINGIYIIEEAQNKDLSFRFTSDNITYNVMLYDEYGDLSFTDGHEEMIVQGETITVVKYHADETVHIIFVYNHNSYNISAQNTEELEKIIDGLELR